MKQKRTKKQTLIYYTGLAFLKVGSVFSSIGNWFWRRHRDILDTLD
jgi:hypothetical protein